MNTQTPELGYVVEVTDNRSQPLTGRSDARYVSPPQDRRAAVELIRLVLGRDEVTGDGPWQTVIAGGQRTVTLRLSDRLFE
ncbi:MAG TPA: hypothetical protein VIJ51_05910 [Solirubrobacteraceae bacterium]